ncbi:beta-amyrin 11-oxidase-like [Tripterygium wilfordii]|uniref:beta-amyrin 11-oxidase-like n=1 Tax=Tripterygium wilfordii TaxID=458696 RepID=UPI0018F7FF7C|nr:beta-amyrin 11-oxidase-like [Tripterygium wilfordii]
MIVNAAIEERKIENKSGMDFSNEKKSMLDLLLEVEDEDGEKMDNITIIDVLSALVFAGHESTAIATMWLLKYLHDNPEILQKVKVFQETLRTANIGVGGFRDVMADVEINGHNIPKGWKVLLMYRYIHMNPEIFPNDGTLERINPKYEVVSFPFRVPKDNFL